MDVLSMIYVLANFSLFTFAFVLFFYLKNKRNNNSFRLLMIASFLFAVGLSLYYFDVESFMSGSNSVVLTFFSFFFSLGGLVVLVRAYWDLIEVEPSVGLIPMFVILVLIGVLKAYIGTSYSIMWRSVISYGVAVVILVYALIQTLKSKKINRVNLITIEILIIFIFVVSLAITSIVNQGSFTYNDPPEALKVFTMQIYLMILLMPYSFILTNSGLDHKKISTQVKMYEQLSSKFKTISEMDELTQLYNRRKMNTLINMCIHNYKTYIREFTMLMIDIDNFKYINDTYGHSNGDIVLEQTSRLLERVVREDDYIGRWGGDEFMILLINTNKEQGNIVKRKLQNALNEVKLNDDDVRIHMSIGVSSYNQNMSFEDLIIEVDKNLYEDKERQK